MTRFKGSVIVAISTASSYYGRKKARCRWTTKHQMFGTSGDRRECVRGRAADRGQSTGTAMQWRARRVSLRML